MQFILNQECVVYFHNLKFDGNFVIYWLMTHGFVWVPSAKNMLSKQFTTLISDMGQWYTISIRNMSDTGANNKIEIRDSNKLIPLSIEEIPKAYGLDEAKGSIDYTKHRPKGYQPTEEEIDYQKHDVSIMAKAIQFMRNNNQKKLTAASNAMADYKSRFSAKEWKKYFPELNVINDGDIRLSYKGGWTYLNPRYKNEILGEGSVYDVNSMYPWAMKYCPLPWGAPVYFSGEYKHNPLYPLYVICFEADFHLKPGKYPSIQLKHVSEFADNEYITDTIRPMVLTLTSVDFELFKHNYNYQITEYFGGYMFKQKVGLFTEYVDYWFSVKTEAKRTGNKGMEKIAKLMLNSLYGKFGSRLTGKSKQPIYIPEKDLVRYKTMENEEERKGGYLPIATFITSYCRDKIVRAAEVCGDRFVYADTDSVHIIGHEPVEGLDCDDFRLGAFKCESKFVRAKFIRQKTYLEIYIEDGDEKMNLKCCGMPRKMQSTVTESDFYEGAVFDHSTDERFEPKLRPIVVPGGVILEETTFQIKKASTVDGGIKPKEPKFERIPDFARVKLQRRKKDGVSKDKGTTVKPRKSKRK